MLQEDIIKIIDSYQSGNSIREISRDFKHDRKFIKNLLIKNNIKLRTLSQANRTYNLDENIFSNIDTHQKAYWLGFISADGSIYKNILKIGLSSKDRDHLEKFKLFLKSTSPIKTYKNKCNGKLYETSEFCVHSKIITDDLLKLGLDNKKSTSLKPAKIAKHLLPSYIRGLMDGDGCYSIMKLKNKTDQLRLNFTGTLDMCNFIMNILCEELQLNKNKITKDNRSLIAHYYACGGNNKVKSIVSYLYKNIECESFLERKYIFLKKHIPNI